MQRYLVVLAHDHGFVTLGVTASCESAARRIVCCYEGCPERAIVSCRMAKAA